MKCRNVPGLMHHESELHTCICTYVRTCIIFDIRRSLDKLLDERSAVVVTRFLASSRSLYKGFDMYLQQVYINYYYVCVCLYSQHAL